ncbi:fasciclin-like arabinogalactan protein 8 [Selaginella moellendorffii]|uniref:fasciclin-like arabinogalactan protein 8 n=1 Tax=Selaginella moellendorffii TaxID=88036 RepID=UPI000D1C8714|nr:fasciclin-like arabinogalactan protein 8 [Selaginella moellendorffii]|eukprot:XP_024542900.1 fasciclin-like arabinogalactan protein 8 [Selaginella moellendorffii]
MSVEQQHRQASLALVCSLAAMAIIILPWASLCGAQNVTVVLENSAPVNTNFSTFSRLLSMTNVTAEINSRSSLTILVPDNSILDSYVGANLEGMHVWAVADFCRYHVLLQYLDTQEIMQMTNQSGLLITTLYQTTGRAEGIDGFVNMTFGNDIQFGLPPPHASGPVATVLNNFVRYPYNMSFMMISKPLMPVRLAQMNRPDHFPSISNALFKGNIYKTFQKLMQDTGTLAAAEDIEHQPFTSGVTVFAPTDSAFQNLPSGSLAALTQSQRQLLVRYHLLPSFFTFGSLRTLKAPLTTLATSNRNFEVNASGEGPSGGLAIATGVSTANVIATLLEDDPVGVYALDAVLLPPEIFPLHSTPPASIAPSPAPPATVPPPKAVQAPAPAPKPAPPPSPSSSPSPPPSATSPPPVQSSSNSSSSSSSSSSPAAENGTSAEAPVAAEGPLAERSDARKFGFTTRYWDLEHSLTPAHLSTNARVVLDHSKTVETSSEMPAVRGREEAGGARSAATGRIASGRLEGQLKVTREDEAGRGEDEANGDLRRARPWWDEASAAMPCYDFNRI